LIDKWRQPTADAVWVGGRVYLKQILQAFPLSPLLLPCFYFFALLFTSHHSPLSERLEQATKNEWNAQNTTWSRTFWPSITRNLIKIRRVLTICQVNLTQSIAMEQKHVDHRLKSPALPKPWLLLYSRSSPAYLPKASVTWKKKKKEAAIAQFFLINNYVIYLITK